MTSVYIPTWMREIVIGRAHGCCEYCQTPAAYSPEIFEFEHPLPRGAQDLPDLANLAWSCLACNRYKTTRTSSTDPQTGEVTPLFNPRTDQWPEHFRWSADLLTIVGQTPTGRATVETLKMNRPAIVKFRLALRSINQHPAQLVER